MVLFLSLMSSPVTAATTPPHAHHMNEQLGADRPMAAALMSPPGKRVTSYGFLPYWISDPLALDFDSLTHVAYFRVGLTASGTPTETSGWNAIADDLVAAAHDVGTKVHLTVAVFDDKYGNGWDLLQPA